MKTNAQDLALLKTQAQAEAKRLLDAWPCVTSVLDKVAVVILESETDLYLRQIIERKFDPHYDYAGCLNYFSTEAMGRIPRCVAEYSLSPESHFASVAELMLEARKQFHEIKTQVSTWKVAGQWNARLHQGAELNLEAEGLTA